MDGEQRAIKEEREFKEWFKGYRYKVLPKEEDVPPKHFKIYERIARAAWQEANCRKNMTIFLLIKSVEKFFKEKESDHGANAIKVLVNNWKEQLLTILRKKKDE